MNVLNPPPSSRTALRNLLIVLAATISVLIYAYGWTVTDINLEKPQEETRRASLTHSLRELASPRVFEQDRVLSPAHAAFLVDCAEGTAPETTTATEDTPYVVVTPACGSEGDIVTVEAFNYEPDSEARIRWIPVEGQTRPRDVLETGREEITVDSGGHFIGTIEVPRIAGSAGQIHQVEFVAATPSGAVRFSNTTHEVIRRMAETIFMALMATSLAIPISVVLSFFAARNLMRPVRVPLGNMMVVIIMLPLGYWIGSKLLSEVGRFALDLGRLDFSDSSAAITFGLFFGTTVATRTLGQLQPNDLGKQLRTVGGQILVAVGVVFVLGLLGGIGILGGDKLGELRDTIYHWTETARIGTWLTRTDVGSWLIHAGADGIGGFGAMIGIIGGLIDLLIVPLAGIVAAFTLSSAVTRFTALPMRDITGVMNHVLGGVLGLFSGAFIMAVTGYIGTGGAFLGLFPPLIAGMMGSGVTKLIYDRLKLLPPSPLNQTIRYVVSLVGIIAAFGFTFWWLNVDRAIIDGTLPSANKTTFLGLIIPVYVYRSLVIGGVLGAAGAALAGVHSPFMIGDVLYNITRNILNALRSIEPLIMGLIFVIWVGIGPFAGVLALTLHSIASLGKLYSEQIETIDAGPIEALQSTGANHLQTIIYAVVPQVVPPYIAFTMYRWDINVRMSTIIGFVGGGGIGLLLNQQIALLQYREAGVAVLAIAIVVSILDFASAKIRERVI